MQESEILLYILEFTINGIMECENRKDNSENIELLELLELSAWLNRVVVSTIDMKERLESFQKDGTC